MCGARPKCDLVLERLPDGRTEPDDAFSMQGFILGVMWGHELGVIEMPFKRMPFKGDARWTRVERGVDESAGNLTP